MVITWAKIRQAIFYLGLMSMAVSIGLFLVAGRYAHQYFYVLRTGGADVEQAKMEWLTQLFSAILFVYAATVLVAFGRGSGRFFAMLACIALLFLENTF